MASNYSLKYNIDIVMCIDATGSMNGILDTVKSNALNFYGDLINSMRKKGKQVNDLRIKVIAFRDYVADGENAMLATDFFRMPDEQEDFRDLVNTISAAAMPLAENRTMALDVDTRFRFKAALLWQTVFLEKLREAKR